MVVETFVVGPLQTNCYLIGCPVTKEAVLVDPGAEAKFIEDTLKQGGWQLKKILLTHGHGDHIGASEPLRQATGAELHIHEADAEMLQDPQHNLTEFMGSPFKVARADKTLQEKDTICFGQDISLEILHTPGHTQGSVCFWGGGKLFSGDTLFAGSVGRTDFPGGSYAQIISSLNEKLLPLPDDTDVYPGHGPETRIGIEKHSNPYFQQGEDI